MQGVMIILERKGDYQKNNDKTLRMNTPGN